MEQLHQGTEASSGLQSPQAAGVRGGACSDEMVVPRHCMTKEFVTAGSAQACGAGCLNNWEEE